MQWNLHSVPITIPGTPHKEIERRWELTVRDMEDILSEIKQKEIDRVVFKTEQLHRFFPVSYTAEQMRREILEMLKLNMNKYWDE